MENNILLVLKYCARLGTRIGLLSLPLLLITCYNLTGTRYIKTVF